MYLEIITPEKQIFQGEVDAVQFPGKEGLFQVLRNHAPIVATLVKGTIKINLADTSKTVDTLSGEIVHDASDDKVARVEVKGGVVEMMNNNIIVLAD
jgi:F-type H+-transporting ATPase subunit epsilon